MLRAENGSSGNADNVIERFPAINSYAHRTERFLDEDSIRR